MISGDNPTCNDLKSTALPFTKRELTPCQTPLESLITRANPQKTHRVFSDHAALAGLVLMVLPRSAPINFSLLGRAIFWIGHVACGRGSAALLVQLVGETLGTLNDGGLALYATHISRRDARVRPLSHRAALAMGSGRPAGEPAH